MKALHEIWFDINTFVFDIDGVLTDGGLFVSEQGNLLRVMNAKDGYAMQLAVKKNYTLIIISGAKNEFSQKRLQGLGIRHIYTSVQDKKQKLQELINDLNLNPAQIAFMGDDMPDIAAMQLVALPCCPKDACTDVLRMVQYISAFDGGRGAARDVIEKVMKARDDWE